MGQRGQNSDNIAMNVSTTRELNDLSSSCYLRRGQMLIRLSQQFILISKVALKIVPRILLERDK